MNLLCPSNFRMMVPKNVFWGATCPLRTGMLAPGSGGALPASSGVLPGCLSARAQARAPAALCGRASSLETSSVFPLAPLGDTRSPRRSPPHSPRLPEGPRARLPRVSGGGGGERLGGGVRAGGGPGGGGSGGVGGEGAGSHKGNRSVSLLPSSANFPVQMGLTWRLPRAARLPEGGWKTCAAFAGGEKEEEAWTPGGGGG